LSAVSATSNSHSVGHLSAPLLVLVTDSPLTQDGSPALLL
jgi:hypothetical protein